MKWLLILVFLWGGSVYGWDERSKIQGKTSSGFNDIEIDASTHAQTSISYEHHEIHAGSHYFLDGAFPLVGSGVTKAFGVSVPAGTKEPHMVFSIGSTGKVTFEMYEGPSGSTFYNGGVAATPLNSNRVSTNTSILSIVAMPNHVASGVSTRLIYKIWGTSGKNPANSGQPGGGARNNEIIFAPGKKYFVLFTSGEADNNINYTAEWYEHTPKE